MILVSIIPLYLISWSSSTFYEKSYVENTAVGLKRTVENRKELISFFLKGQKGLLEQLIQLCNCNDLTSQDDLEKVFMSLGDVGIVDLGVLNASGDLVAYVGPYEQKLVGKNYADTEWFQEVMISGSHISDISSGYRGLPHIVVAVAGPLKKWVLRSTINSEILNGLVRSAQIGDAGDAFIVNYKGKFQTPSRFGQVALAEEEKELVYSHEGTEVKQIKGHLYVTSWIRDVGWLLVVKVKSTSDINMFSSGRNMVLVSIFIASWIIVLISNLMMRWMMKGMEAADREKAALDSHMLQVDKMASLGRLAGGVAHEVNNPLQLITDQVGWIEDLMSEEDSLNVKNAEEYRESLKKIRHYVKRASSVTHRLLGFSRKMQSEKEAVNMNDVVEEAISFLQTDAKHSRISIEKDLQKDLPTTMTDASKLLQVILNLTNNGMDAAGDGGVVKITTRSTVEQIVLKFEDNGPGIKSEIIDKIFDPFFTTKEPGKGTGLGLAISYSIIQKLGADIEASNSSLGGALFTIILPIVKMKNQFK